MLAKRSKIMNRVDLNNLRHRLSLQCNDYARRSAVQGAYEFTRHCGVVGGPNGPAIDFEMRSDHNRHVDGNLSRSDPGKKYGFPSGPTQSASPEQTPPQQFKVLFWP